MWKRFDRGEIENIVSTFEESYKTNKKSLEANQFLQDQ
jgi:hypothetical protein